MITCWRASWAALTPTGRQTDGLGSGVSSTSKVVLLSRSPRPDADIDYLFGHVDIESGRIDWSGTCGNLSAAVGPAAILAGLIAAPAAGELLVRIWQVNTAKHILARVPIQDGLPAQHGEHSQDGLAFPGAPIQLDFLDPAGSSGGALFPTGQPCDLRPCWPRTSDRGPGQEPDWRRSKRRW